MLRFLIDLSIDTKGKKIDAIKEARRMLGVGLKEAKDLVEAPRRDDMFAPTTGGMLIANAEQVARIVAYSYASDYSQPSFTLVSVKELAEPNAIDISGIVR